MTETRSLHRKLAQVMFEAARIPKNGTAPAAMGGFKFVQVGDAADVIRKALAEQGVSMIPSAIELLSESDHPTSSGKIMTTMTVRTTWTLTDGESGETAVIQSMGSGADMGDKAAPKAQSNAMKYALLMGFLLSTGDDPEQTDTSDRRRPAGDAQGIDDTRPPKPTSLDGGLIGTVEKGTSAQTDFQLRQTPTGMAVGFRLVAKGRISVQAASPLAEVLAPFLPGLEGVRVQCFGTIRDETWKPPKSTKPMTYQVMALERIVGPDWTLPAPDEPEAETAPLFDDVDVAQLDAAVLP